MNNHRMVDGVEVLLTDEEQAEFDARVAEHFSTQQVQTRLKSALATHRYSVANGGTNLFGFALRTDDTSRANLMAAFLMASTDPTYTVQWKTENGFVTLDAAMVKALATGVAAFVQKCFTVEATLAASISQYATNADVISAFDNAMKG